MVAAPAMHHVRHPRDGFATDFTDREVWSLALRRRDAHSVAVGHAAEQDRQSQTVAVDFGSARETKMTISCDLWFSRTSGVPLKISSACRKGRPGRSGLGADGAGPRLEIGSTRLNSSHVAISYAVFCLKKKNQ